MEFETEDRNAEGAGGKNVTTALLVSVVRAVR